MNEVSGDTSSDSLPLDFPQHIQPQFDKQGWNLNLHTLIINSSEKKILIKQLRLQNFHLVENMTFQFKRNLTPHFGERQVTQKDRISCFSCVYDELCCQSYGFWSLVLGFFVRIKSFYCNNTSQWSFNVIWSIISLDSSGCTLAGIQIVIYMRGNFI